MSLLSRREVGGDTDSDDEEDTGMGSADIA